MHAVQTPYVGMWIQIKHRFGPRITEWIISAIMTLWGAVLLLPSDTFEGDNFVFFKAIMSENSWGIFMMFVGFSRIIGLIINGSRKKVTPWIRVVSAGIGFILWVGIICSFAMSGVISTWLAVYPVIAITELVNIWRAATDAGGSRVP